MRYLVLTGAHMGIAYASPVLLPFVAAFLSDHHGLLLRILRSGAGATISWRGWDWTVTTTLTGGRPTGLLVSTDLVATAPLGSVRTMVREALSEAEADLYALRRGPLGSPPLPLV